MNLSGSPKGFGRWWPKNLDKEKWRCFDGIFEALETKMFWKAVGKMIYNTNNVGFHIICLQEGTLWLFNTDPEN